jgi:hypothetical protein
MDIQQIKEIISPSIEDAIKNMQENNVNFNVTILKKIINESINKCLSGESSNDSLIMSMFSGHGKAWAKVDVDNNNPVWIKVKQALELEINLSKEGSENYLLCTNILDLFEAAGFAWLRFGSISKNICKFHLRKEGSKLETHIKIYVEPEHVLNNTITNLQGVPHKLGLESGNLLKEIKEILSKKDISKEQEYIPLTNKSDNILSIEDLMNA